MGTDSNKVRLHLYLRVARALNTFFDRWTGAFCERCLEVTARAHADDPRAAVALLRGRFAGCCQAGVGEATTVPCAGTSVQMPALLAERLSAGRRERSGGAGEGIRVTLRERHSGRRVEGVGCRYLGERGCRLGEYKAPLCLTYVCTGVRTALIDVVGFPCWGEADDNFCGSADALMAVFAEPLPEAERQVGELESCLLRLHRRLGDAGVRSGQELLVHWLQQPP